MSLKVSLQNEVDKLERLQGQGLIAFRGHLSNLLCEAQGYYKGARRVFLSVGEERLASQGTDVIEPLLVYRNLISLIKKEIAQVAQENQVGRTRLSTGKECY